MKHFPGVLPSDIISVTVLYRSYPQIEFHPPQREREREREREELLFVVLFVHILGCLLFFPSDLHAVGFPMIECGLIPKLWV